MLGFHRARPEAPAAAPASSSTSSSQKERRSHAREDDLKRMLAFLPICAPNPLPVDFTYHLPGDRPTTAHHDPYLLAYYGATSQQHLNYALHEAARLVAGPVREGLRELSLIGAEELSVLLEQGTATGLTHGFLVRVQVFCTEAPSFSDQPARWKTCGDGWKYNAGNGLGWIFVQFFLS